MTHATPTEPVRDPQTAAFRALERALARRRLAGADLGLRLIVLAITVLGSGFLFWQTRIPFDAFARAGGAPRPALALAAWLGGFALLAGWGAGLRHARLLVRHRLGVRPSAPAWLALPIAPRALARHLVAESRLPALLAFPAAAAVLVAAIGLIPPLWIGLAAAAFIAAWLELTRLGCAFSLRLAARGVPVAAGPGAPLALPVRALAGGRAVARTQRLERAARWRRATPARAVFDKDARHTFRARGLRERLAGLLLATLAAFAAWLLPAPPEIRRALAFALVLLAAGFAGVWIVALTASDPFGALRPLPIALGAIWGARLAWLVLAVVPAAVLHAVLAPGLAPAARFGLALWWSLAALALGVLALHYALTLYPRGGAAENLFVAWLGVSAAASLMVPFMGWLVLIAGLIHVTRRLSRWRTLEPA